MKITTIAALLIATAGTALPMAAIAYADADNFETPSGNIQCILGNLGGSAPVAECSIRDFTFVAPPVSPCDGGPTPAHQFKLDQGKPGHFMCAYSDLRSTPDWPTLDYGQTRSLGTMTCDSEPAGITCRDSSTGHFFFVSRDSYDVG